MKKIFITGGAGFIGSEFVRRAFAQGYSILNFDKLTYASDPSSLKHLENEKNYRFVRGDICDAIFLKNTIKKFSPNVLVHFAAESHVDNSIDEPSAFIETNIIGTYNLLRILLEMLKDRRSVLLIHVSTDEVYGDLTMQEPKFTNESRYKPSSPYAASKAASDHLVQAWRRTYGLSSIVTHCSNNYGPHQNDEKFVPTVIRSALQNKKIPIYGKGENIRDWIHVRDHVDALIQIMEKGRVGETYNIGGQNEFSNLTLAGKICNKLDAIRPKKNKGSYGDQIALVKDRLGHDQRYAIDNSHIEKNLGWKPEIDFSKGLEETIEWYVKKYV